MKKLLLIVVCGLVASSLMLASPVACASISDVLAIAGPANGCTAGPLTFLFFANSVTPSSGFNTATIGISSSTVTGGAVNLDFQIGNLTGSGIHLAGKSGDIILLYEVLGGITGIDQNWGGTVDPATQGANITIIETACSVAFTSASSSCANADILGQLTGTILTGSQAFVGNTNFTTTSYATYIKKDIQFSEGNLSDFVNSADIPEPMTFILLGGGLLGLGILKRRLA